MDYSKFLRLGQSDLVKGLVVAVLAVVLGAIQNGLTVHGLDFTSYDWRGILDLSWKVAGVYLTKNLLTAENGKVLGRIG
ncbi:MAG: hypothetical protein AABY22_21755 [Nanoarchaeota archaeon]